jgi:hypothetical protein
VRLHHLLRFVLVGAVHPGDRLQQRVIAHRLVEIHRVEHRRVEAGEQLLGDDQDLGNYFGSFTTLDSQLSINFLQPMGELPCLRPAGLDKQIKHSE